MTVAFEPIKIEGLREFIRALKDMDADLAKKVRGALNRAAQVIVDYAYPRIPTRTGRAKASVKARSTRREVRVVGGGKRVPYYPWLDFGGKVGRAKAVRRAFFKEGRYIYKAYYQSDDEFDRALVEAITELANEAGVEVTTGGE